MTAQIAASAAYIVAALLFILPWPGCPSTRRPSAGNAFGIAGMAIALVATIGAGVDRRHHRARASRC